MRQQLLAANVILGAALAGANGDQEPLFDYREACPDYTYYSAHPQYGNQ
jgi:hypothetical protein